MCLIAERSIAELIKFQFQKGEARVFFHIAKETMYDRGSMTYILMKTGALGASGVLGLLEN